MIFGLYFDIIRTIIGQHIGDICEVPRHYLYNIYTLFRTIFGQHMDNTWEIFAKCFDILDNI